MPGLDDKKTFCIDKNHDDSYNGKNAIKQFLTLNCVILFAKCSIALYSLPYSSIIK
jgi:hypothetical protein